MAGGEGKRLRPITCTMPKPMVPLLNKPVIDYCIELLKSHGIEDITATLHYLPRVITNHCGDGEKYGVKLSYSIENKPLGTAGSVRKAMGDKPERAIVISGDAMTDLDITSALKFHTEKSGGATIVLKQVDVPTEYGVVLMKKGGQVYRFLEKPMMSEVFSDLANTGIYILEPEVIERIPKGQKFDFSKDLFPLLLREQIPIYGYITDKYWCDIGDISQYRAAQRDMLTGRCRFKTIAKEQNGIWIEPGALISEKATLSAPCYIGSGAEIGAAVITDSTVVGSGSRIGDHSSAKRTVIMQNVRIRENVEMRGAILCEGAEAESGASMFSDTVIGWGGRAGKNSTLCNGASVWPEKRVSEEQTCRENIRWDDGERPGEGSVSGYTDTLLTPERAARIGGAFAASLGRLPLEAAVATDGSQQGVMLKHGIISGLVAQGVDAADMGYCSRSAFEHSIREFGYSGGIYIRCGAAPHRVELILCDKTGTELTGSGYRAFEQELKAGAKRPITSERLGIVQRVSGAAKAYEAHLNRVTHSVKGGGNGLSILIGGSPEVYDGVARVLLPCGYSVRYYSGSADRLYSYVAHERADMGFYVEDGVKETVALERHISEDSMTAVLAIAAAEDKRTDKLVLPTHLPGEYLRLIAQKGAKVSIAPSKKSRWARSALENNAYMPEFFEPEARIIRGAELMLSGRLEKYLDMLPNVEQSETDIKCSWKDVGRMLRSLVDTEKYENIELVDGVKVQVDRGWVLVKPNAAITACRIIAGSMDAEYSKELTDIYGSKLRHIAEQREE